MGFLWIFIGLFCWFSLDPHCVLYITCHVCIYFVLNLIIEIFQAIIFQKRACYFESRVGINVILRLLFSSIKDLRLCLFLVSYCRYKFDCGAVGILLKECTSNRESHQENGIKIELSRCLVFVKVWAVSIFVRMHPVTST